METPDELREKAHRYRRMTALASDPRLIDALNGLADEYEARAVQLEGHGRNRSTDGNGSVSPDRPD